MKKLLLICSIILLYSCSNNDTDENNEMITAKEYGVIIKGPDMNYSYKFFHAPTGEILKQGELSWSENLFFPVTEKELRSENISFELQVEDGEAENLKAFLISRKNDLYLNYEDNPEATSVFEMNNTIIRDGVIEGTIPVKMHRNFWVENSEWSNND